MLWLPELSQEVLNNMALAYFMATRQLERDLENDELRKYVTSARELFQGIERRGESVEAVLAHGDKTLMKEERDPRKASVQRQKRRHLSDPSFLAGLILHAKKHPEYSSVDIARKLEGVRFLPDIDVFEYYAEAVLANLDVESGPSTWLRKGSQLLNARGALQEETNAQFSAEDEDGCEVSTQGSNSILEPASMMG